MSVEAITDAIHEYMYEKVNETSETDRRVKESPIRGQNKIKNSKQQTERYPKTRRLDCNKCRAPNWSKQHECPAR